MPLEISTKAATTTVIIDEASKVPSVSELPTTVDRTTFDKSTDFPNPAAHTSLIAVAAIFLLVVVIVVIVVVLWRLKKSINQ